LGDEKKKMNKTEKGYQGWKNYETWDVALWIDNDQGFQELIFEMGRDAKDTSAFADSIKEFIEEMAPDLEASMFSDLLNAALGEVDWYELADSYLKEIAEMDKYEEEQ
jgi:7-cyano-7-deazaguanine synthase in queuosine biosynthesis